MRPEFLARVDEVVVFRPLDEGDFRRIAGLMLGELKDPLAEKGIKFGWDDEAAAPVSYTHLMVRTVSSTEPPALQNAAKSCVPINCRAAARCV